MDERRLINVSEAASLLNVKPSWLYLKSHQNALPPDVLIRVGNYLRFDREALLAFVKKGGARV